MQLDRDRIWFFAWACVPLALLVNDVVGAGVERSTRLAQQANVDFDSGDWLGAAERYGAAAEAAPTSALFAFNAGAAYLRAGKLTAAARWTAEALRRDPHFAQAKAAEKAIRNARLRAHRPPRNSYPEKDGNQTRTEP